MTALPKLRWMALPIAVGLGVINLSPEPAAVPDASIKTFTEWCEERAELPPETAHTVDQLLLLTGTKDCAAADALISQQETLILERLELQDLRPLSAFTQVTWLSLAVNDIEDITPLQSLTNLEYLYSRQQQHR
jgi:internalin A